MSCPAFKMAKYGPGDTAPKIPMQKRKYKINIYCNLDSCLKRNNNFRTLCLLNSECN